MRKYNNILFLLILFGSLLSCGGQQRSWSPQKEVPSVSSGGETPVAGSPVKRENLVVFADIQPLFQKHCAFCHLGGVPNINWVLYEVAKGYANDGRLYERIWTLRNDPGKGMPLANAFGMTEDERKRIVKWIEDGGLE